MAGWSSHRGRAVWLELDNIDTDQLIPARFMSAPRTAGYGDYLLYDLRRDTDGGLQPDFPLNAAPGASILLAGRNFGSGSSREAAVYALADAGFRAVIAPGFGDIFAANAVNNGVLPAQVAEADYTTLASAIGRDGAEVMISLDRAEIRCGDIALPFALDDSRRLKLQKGWDDIDLTQQHQEQIDAFKTQRRRDTRWAWPTPQDHRKGDTHDQT